MTNSKVSIIVPVYNVEKYLRGCVDSVLSQTYKNLEIILVDDGSPDNCPQICDEYVKLDTRVKVIHKENGGLSSARNAGLDEMTGDYVQFVDSDDYIEPEMIETMLSRLESGNGDVAICLEKCDDEKLFEGDIYKNILEDKIGSQVWRYLFKAEKFAGGGIRFPIGRNFEDVAIMHNVLYQNKIVYVARRLYNYNRDNQDSILNTPNMKKRYKTAVDAAIAFSNRFEWMKDKNDIEKESKDNALQIAFSRSIGAFHRYYRNDSYKQDIDYLYNFLKQNKKEIKKLKNMKRINKLQYKFILMCPNLFARICAVLIRFKRK